MPQAWVVHINFYIEERTNHLMVKGLDDHDKNKMHADGKAVIDEGILRGVSMSIEEQ